MAGKKNKEYNTKMELYSISADVSLLDNKITGEIQNIKENFKKKTGIGTATIQAALATAAMGFITLGLKTIETDLQTGTIMAALGAILLIIDFYISGK